MNDPSMPHLSTTLKLGFGLEFSDLYAREGLERLDGAFVAALKVADVALYNRLMTARAAPAAATGTDHSDLLVDLAPVVEDFIAALFGIAAEARALQARQQELAPLHAVKRNFVQRRAAKKYAAAEAASFDGAALRRQLEALIGSELTELGFAQGVERWMGAEAEHAPALEAAARYAAWALHAPEGRRQHGRGVLFQTPHKLDSQRLIPVETEVVAGVRRLKLPEHLRRAREGFALTDPGTGIDGALDHANYCIWCHNQSKDSCSKGLKDKKTGEFQKSAFGVPLAGCPLEEKISEMNLAFARGRSVGALAIAVVDNPMCAATGHRICNDCMKACIYQKQEPVDIPQVETRILKDVLSLPWGFEIYALLTRWNPLNIERPLPQPASGRKVLVVGLGPAGFTLAHHLLNDGHAVVAVDGLKIEPLAAEVSGIDVGGQRRPFRPIRDIAELREPLDSRVMAGFGGVAEYGITVRWDKNYLKLIRLLLERREAFRMYGGVRFGGTLTIEDAFALGFDHIALCAGAGRPTIVPMKNGLVPGVRQASDFLMALQLTGAAKNDSVASLQVRLPIAVIGGGLTAIDTATEALAYYPVQVEKFLARYETLVAERGEAAVEADWTEQDREIAAEFLAHARAIRAERTRAAGDARPARIGELLRAWGGSTIVYRRRLIDSPGYTLNHEEVAKAFEEGIAFAEQLTPLEVVLDARGAARALRCNGPSTGANGQPAPGECELAARTILVAAGTQPNTVLGREDPAHVEIDGKYFRAVDEAGHPANPERSAKPAAAHMLMSLRPDGRAISFFGDLHPSFAGNVVKAMASAKRGYPVLSRMLARLPACRPGHEALFARLDDELRPRVQEVIRLTPKIVEIVVRAPMAARAFKPGQFYRLQNYESSALQRDGTRLAMEGLALTGAAVDRARGLISTIVLEMGGSSDLCAHLAPGEPVVLMGPTGAATETPAGKTVLLIGGGLGNAVLLSIGRELRAKGSRVLYFAGYRETSDRYKVSDIELAGDAIVWCCDQAPGFAATRPQDRAVVGNIVTALRAYADGALGDQPIPLGQVDHIIAIGSDTMMAAVAAARRGMLHDRLKPGHTAIASVNSPMQCMMKEICAQCLQVHRDPATGLENVVFSCFNQDQPLDLVDFDNLHARLGQNAAQEKLARLWIDRTLRHLGRR